MPDRGNQDNVGQAPDLSWYKSLLGSSLLNPEKVPTRINKDVELRMKMPGVEFGGIYCP